MDTTYGFSESKWATSPMVTASLVMLQRHMRGMASSVVMLAGGTERRRHQTDPLLFSSTPYQPAYCPTLSRSDRSIRRRLPVRPENTSRLAAADRLRRRRTPHRFCLPGDDRRSGRLGREHELPVPPDQLRTRRRVQTSQGVMRRKSKKGAAGSHAASERSCCCPRSQVSHSHRVQAASRQIYACSPNGHLVIVDMRALCRCIRGDSTDPQHVPERRDLGVSDSVNLPLAGQRCPDCYATHLERYFHLQYPHARPRYQPRRIGQPSQVLHLLLVQKSRSLTIEPSNHHVPPRLRTLPYIPSAVQQRRERTIRYP